jgi:hypothetical protein
MIGYGSPSKNCFLLLIVHTHRAAKPNFIFRRITGHGWPSKKLVMRILFIRHFFRLVALDLCRTSRGEVTHGSGHVVRMFVEVTSVWLKVAV